MPEPFVSYSQNGEDIVIARVFHDLPGPGFFVDVGAADPFVYSVTYALYQRGWRGINVEPVRRFADALRSARPYDITVESAAGEESGTIVLHVAEGTGLSTTDELASTQANELGYETVAIEVPVRTLDSILTEHCEPGRDVHLLKVDVEGAERAVLAGARLDRWRPWLCVVEATRPLSRQLNHEGWHDLLSESGYEFCLFDGLNRFYLAAEHMDLSDRLASGACIFDQPFQRAEITLALERHQDAVAHRLAEAQREISALRQSTDSLTAELDAERATSATLRAANDARVRELADAASTLDAALDQLATAERRLDDVTAERSQINAALDGERANLAVTRAQLEGVYASPTWRVGSSIGSVARLTGVTALVRRRRHRETRTDG